MTKNALFMLKNRNNRRELGTPPPDPLASGGWGLCPQTPATAPPTTNSWLCSCSHQNYSISNHY